MYAELPEPVKRIVTEYLLADDFKTAKKIHDEWVLQHNAANQTVTEYPS